jgi:hypothetical protein
MPDFNVRSDSVNVEQIMEQIRARIREKRGVDYTEQQLREIAAVKLEKFLDPRGVRSDLLEQFKRHQPAYEPPVLPTFTFEDTTIYETPRGLLRMIRKLLNPILKLFFNPNPIIHVLHTQADLNAVNLQREAAREKQRMEIDALYYEVIHNLVFEMTRLGIDTKNVKMRVESIASRLEFNERRARALESVVAYRVSEESDSERRPEAPPVQAPRPQQSSRPQNNQGGWTPPPAPQPAQAIGESIATSGSVPYSGSPTSGAPGGQPSPGAGQQGGSQGSQGSQGPQGPEGPGQRSRRRRRRRGRRGGGGAPSAVVMGAPGSTGSTEPAPQSADAAFPAEARSDAPAAPTEPERAPESSGPDNDTDPQ